MSLEVKKRVRALKRLILAQNEIQLRFKAEVHLLNLKYQKVYEPYINKQTDIIQGNYEPTKSEYSCSEEEDEQDPKYDELGEIGLEPCKQEPKGIPDFWLLYMKDSYKFNNNILPHDEPILRHLSDIRCNLSEEYIGFTMEFHFTSNEWFTNNVLTLKFEEDPSDDIFQIVYDTEGAIEYRLTGCEINWNEGKNVTQQIKNETLTLEGTEVSINKTVENPSFFNLFNDTLNLINLDRLYFQSIFKLYKKKCNWLILEAFKRFYILHQGNIILTIAEILNFPEDYETSESYIETDVEDDKCTSHSQMK